MRAWQQGSATEVAGAARLFTVLKAKRRDVMRDPNRPDPRVNPNQSEREQRVSESDFSPDPPLLRSS